MGLALIALWLNWPVAAFGDDTLFLDAPQVTAALTVEHEPDITRERSARVSWNALTPNTQQLRLNLFDDVVLTTQNLRIDQQDSDNFVWVGRITGAPDSLVTLAVRGNHLVGSVREKGLERYRIIGGEADSLGRIAHRIQEIDPSEQIEPNGIDAIVPRPSAQELAEHQDTSTETCEDGSLIDLLIAYTAAARELVGGTESMEALIDLRVSEMNSANLASAAGFQWRLADSMEVTYDESGSLMTDLNRLRITDDNYMDGLHMVREAADADLVNLIVAEGTDGACGMAFQMNELQPWFSDYAFGITALDYAGDYVCSSLTLAHEFGHGMGNAHDYANSGGGALFPYGYGFQNPGGAFRTIMAYDCGGEGCPRINHWSNPNVLFNDAPTGVEYDDTIDYGADVVRAMDEARQTVANFRPTCDVAPTETPTLTPVPDASPVPSETPQPTATDTPTPTSTATTEVVVPSATPITPSPSPTVTSSPTTISTESAPTSTPGATSTLTVTPSVTRPITLPLPYILQIPVVLYESD